MKSETMERIRRERELTEKMEQRRSYMLGKKFEGEPVLWADSSGQYVACRDVIVDGILFRRGETVPIRATRR